MPAFSAWDDLDLITWTASAPYDAPVPAPFSAQFEFESGITSQGFFDENGMLSTLAPETIFSFLGEPSYGFVSDLRPDSEPAVEIALAVAGVPLPTDVAAPASLSLFGVALLALAARRRATGLTPPITEKARLN